MPSLKICVKSFATILSLPPACKSPSTFIPTHPVPNVDTFCTYGDLFEIHARVSAVPQPGSKLTNAPALGRLVPNEFAVLSVPLRPLNEQLRKPVPLRSKNIFSNVEPITAFT